MIQSLLGLFETAGWLAIVAATLWGVASVLLSPCHLSSVPLMVAFLKRAEGQTLKEKGIAAWVTVGVSLSLIAVAIVGVLAGRVMGDLWGIGPWIMVVFLISAGLYLLGAFEFPSLAQLRPERVKTGAAGAVGAGGVLGLTLGPCTFAFFAPVLALSIGPATLLIKVFSMVGFIGAHLASTWAAGVLGARLSRWMSQSGRFAKPLKYLVGIAAIAVAVEMIINTP